MKRILSISLVISTMWSATSLAEVTPSIGNFFSVSAVGQELSVRTLPTPNSTNPSYSGAGILGVNGFSVTTPVQSCFLGGNFGYCLFPSITTTPQTINISGPAGALTVSLCLDGSGKFSCADYSLPGNRFAYVTKPAQGVFKCPMDPTTGIINSGNDGANCVNQASVNITSPHGITLNANGSLAYITNEGQNTIVFCSVSSSDGSLSNCSQTAVSFPFGTPETIKFNPAGTYAYIAQNNANGIVKCTVGSNGALNNCADQTNYTTTADGFAFNPLGTYLYITLSTNQIFKCGVSLVDGTLTDCASTTTVGSESLHGIVISPSGLFAYVNGYNSDVIYYCSVSQTDGTLTGCITSGCNVNNPEGITMNTAGTQVYSVAFLNTIVNGTVAADGSLTNCNTQQYALPPTVSSRLIALR